MQCLADPLLASLLALAFLLKSGFVSQGHPGDTVCGRSCFSPQHLLGALSLALTLAQQHHARVTAEQRLETPSGGDGLKVEEGPFARFSESLRQSTQFTASHSDAPHISLNA